MNTFRRGASAYLSVSGRDCVAVPAVRAPQLAPRPCFANPNFSATRALRAATSSAWLLFCLLFVSAFAAHAATLTVTSTADTDGSTCGATCTLRQALNAASGNGAAQNTINFDARVFAAKQTIKLSQGLLPPINTDIILTGPTASGAGVTVDAGGNSRIFGVIGGTSTFSNLTLSGGNINGDDGGAIKQGGASVLTLNNCTIAGNTSGGKGGAIFTNAQLTLNSCTLSGNTSSSSGGGAIFSSGTLTLNSCTLSGNRAGNGGEGGGILSNGTLTLNSSTLSGNRAGNGGGVIGRGTFNSSNTIVAGNTATNNPDVSGTINAGDYNLIGNSQGAIFPASASHNITNVAPKLGPLKDNGGPTFTLALQSGSPAIDAGNTALTTDQRGSRRPVDIAGVANAAGGNGSDIGAVELNEAPQSGANFVVNQTDDHDDGVCGPTDCTLREAIGSANGDPDTSTVTFSPTVFSTNKKITFNGSRITIEQPLILTGPATGVTIDTLADDSEFQVNASTQVSNLTMQNGEHAFEIVGGDSITNCTFTNCTFTRYSFAIDIRAAGSTISVSNSTFSGNKTALFVYPITPSVILNVSSSTIANNEKGIRDDDMATINVSNSIIAGNTTNLAANATITDKGFNLVGGDPKLGPLQDNGGPTLTLALQSGSPAIDAGNTPLTTDQRGRVRPFDFAGVANAAGGNGSDIGAFELNETPQSGANFVVNQITDTDDGVCGPTDCTLREAINAANGDGDFSEISFDATVFAAKQTITLTLGSLPDFASDVTVSGPTARGAGVTVKGANNIIFQTNSGSVTLSALTVTNGYVGIFTLGGATTVQGCTLTGHFIGVQFNGGDLAVRNCTLSGNTNSGIINNSDNGNNNSNATVTSSTLSGNSSGISNLRGSTTTVSNSIVTDRNLDITDGGFNLIGVDAKLGPLKDNGGPTQTFALLAGSPAINAGSNALIPDGVVTDQRGPGFARIVGGTVDIGAFELDPPQSGPNFVVNQTDDHDDGTCGTTDCTLREAVGAANRNGAGTDTISFSALFDTAQTITLKPALSEIAITASVTIDGPGARLLTVDAANANRVFGIGAGNTWQTGPPGSTTTISGLTLVKGRNGDSNGGGALFNEDTVTLNNCTLSGNTAGRGGAISNKGTLTLNSCTLSGNTSRNSGGAIYNSGTLTLNSCTLSGNTAGALGRRYPQQRHSHAKFFYALRQQRGQWRRHLYLFRHVQFEQHHRGGQHGAHQSRRVRHHQCGRLQSHRQQARRVLPRLCVAQHHRR